MSILTTLYKKSCFSVTSPRIKQRYDSSPPVLTPLQVLVLLSTPPVSPGGAGPARQAQTPAGQRAAGRPAEGRPDGAQQHGQQLQPERQSHMRHEDVDARSSAPSAA